MELFKIFGTIGINDEEAKKRLRETANQAQKTAEIMGKGFNKIGDTFNNIGESLSKIGRTASVVTGAIVGVMAASFTKAKAFIGTYESAMTVFTRKLEGGEVAAGKMYDSLVKIAKGSAFSQEYLVSAGQTLVAMGLDADKTSKYVQAATDAISGMGGSGAQVQEMATLFAKVSQQTNLYTQDIQQMVERGIPAWDILATKYGTTTDKVKKMASDGLIPATESLDAITGALEETNEQSEYFKYSVAGLASELKSGTLTGSMDSLNSSFRTFSLTLLDLDPRTESGKENISKLNNIIATFGETMEKVGSRFSFVGEWIGTALSKINDYLTTFNETLDTIPQETLEDIARVVLGIAAAGPALLISGKAFSIIGDAFNGLSSVVSLFSKIDLGGIASSLYNLGSGFLGVLNPMKLFSSISSGLQSVVGFLSMKINTLASAFTLSGGGLSGSLTIAQSCLASVGSAFGSLMAAMAPVAAAIAAIVSAIIVLKDNWDKVVQTFQNFIANTGLTEKFNQIKESIAPLWEKLQGLKDLFTVIGTIVITALQPAFAFIVGAFNGIVSAIAPLMTAIGGLLDILGGLGTFIVSIFTGDLQAAGDAVKQIGQGIVDVFGGLWDAVYGLLQGFVNGVIQWFTSLWDALVGHSIVPDMINAIINWFKELLNKPIQFVIELKDKVINFFNQLKATASNIFDAIKNKIVSIWESIKNTTVTVWNNIKSTVNNVINAINGLISNVFNAIKSVVTNAWNSIKSTTSNVWNSVKSSVSNVANGIKSTVSSAFNTVKSTVTSIWNGIKSAIMNPINAAKDGVRNAINMMKGFFNFSWSLPKLKLPHFKISGKFSLNPPSVPSFGISWYKKALDDAYLLNSPTIFGMDPNGTLLGGGEAGSEAIVGTDLLKNMIQTATSNGNSYLAEKLDKILMYLQAAMPELSNRQIVLDTGALAGALTPEINKNLGTITASMARGRSY